MNAMKNIQFAKKCLAQIQPRTFQVEVEAAAETVNLLNADLEMSP